MCRWLAYSGSPIALQTVLLEPEHSLIDQSLHAQMGVATTNGDGFGVGWYDEGREPGVYNSISPAWNDRNLRELAKHVKSNLFLAHIRASTGTAIQQTNYHPFRHDQWLWMHNGQIRGFDTVKRVRRNDEATLYTIYRSITGDVHRHVYAGLCPRITAQFAGS